MVRRYQEGCTTTERPLSPSVAAVCTVSAAQEVDDASGHTGVHMPVLPEGDLEIAVDAGKLQLVGDRVVAARPTLLHRPAVEVHADRLSRAVQRLDACAVVVKACDMPFFRIEVRVVHGDALLTELSSFRRL